MTERDDLESQYLRVLEQRMGLPCRVEGGGFLTFAAGGRRFFVLLDRRDPGLLRLGTTEGWPSGARPEAAGAAATSVNRRCPGVKATLADDRAVVVLTAEMVVAPDRCPPSARLLVAVVERMTAALAAAALVFLDDVVLQGHAAEFAAAPDAG